MYLLDYKNWAICYAIDEHFQSRYDTYSFDDCPVQTSLTQ